MISPERADGLIDFHAHFLTDHYVEMARSAGHTHPDGMPTWAAWSVSDHLELMDRNDIQRAVLSISSPGVHFGNDDAAAGLARHVNECAAEIAREHPARFEFLASLPLPAVEAAVDEAVYAMDILGACGVIVMSNNDGQYLGDTALDPLWALLDQRKSITFVHPTSPPNADLVALDRPHPMLEFMFETTRTVTDMIFGAVAERFPHIRFLIPHCGATLPILADRIELFRSQLLGQPGHPPTGLTTRQQLERFWYDLAGTPLPTQVAVLTGIVGEHHIVYGSDFCWTPAAAVANQVASLDDASDASTNWRTLTSANAIRLLGRSNQQRRPQR